MLICSCSDHCIVRDSRKISSEMKVPVAFDHGRLIYSKYLCEEIPHKYQILSLAAVLKFEGRNCNMKFMR